MSETLPRAFGPYLLLARLGQGAAGTAYLARPLDDTRGIPAPVVVKCLHEKLQGNDEYVRRFRHEAELAVRVNSSHVARVYDVGAVGETLYIALEYVPGWTLGRVLSAMVGAQRLCPLPVARALTVGTLEGLAALHTATDAKGRPLEIVHRDVSPKNVMVGDDGLVRIIDLGLGKSNAQDWKTSAGRVMGSPGYMAREQLLSGAVDQRADLYAVGVMLHELLVGARYLKPDSSLNMLRVSLEKAFTPPSQGRAEVSPALDRLVEKAMAPQAEARFGSAQAFSRAVAQAIEAPNSGAVVGFVEGLLGQERRARVAEVERLLGLDFNLEEAEPEALRTEIFVRREGVSDLGDPTRFVPRPAPQSAARREDATRLLAPPVAEPRPVTPANSSSSQQVLVLRAPSRWPTIVGTVLVALLVGLIIGVTVGGSRAPQTIEARAVPAEAVPTVSPSVVEAPEVAVEALPVAPPPTAAPSPVSPPPAPPPPPSKRRPSRIRPQGPNEPTPGGIVDPKEVVRLGHQLQQQVLDKKAEAPGDLELQRVCDKFLARVAMARASRDPEQSLAQLESLAQELKTLGAH